MPELFVYEFCCLRTSLAFIRGVGEDMKRNSPRLPRKIAELDDGS